MDVIFRLETFAGNFRLVTSVWNLSLVNFRLGSFAWELSIGNFRSGKSPFSPTMPFLFALVYLCWLLYSSNMVEGRGVSYLGNDAIL